MKNIFKISPDLEGTYNYLMIVDSQIVEKFSVERPVYSNDWFATNSSYECSDDLGAGITGTGNTPEEAISDLLVLLK